MNCAPRYQRLLVNDMGANHPIETRPSSADEIEADDGPRPPPVLSIQLGLSAQFEKSAASVLMLFSYGAVKPLSSSRPSPRTRRQLEAPAGIGRDRPASTSAARAPALYTGRGGFRSTPR